jgi:phenylalanyl-tRNA synthetase beta chain
MRQSVLSSVLDVVRENLKNTPDVHIFEIGSVYLERAGQKLPDEPRRLAVVMTGCRHAEFWADGGKTPPAPLDFFDLKGVVAALVDCLHLSGVAYRPAQVPYLHPGKAAELLVGETPVGVFGEMHPRVAEKLELGARVVLAGEFDLEALRAATPERFRATPVPRFPAALRDVAVVVDESIPAERVAAEIRAGGGDLLAGVRLFDLFRGENLPAGSKSLAYALTYQAEDRTLTDKEVDQTHKKIENRLRHMLKAQIRGKE